MDIADFCTQSSVIIVAGKGGVGKTTVSAALARTAARSGLSVLIVELEGKSAREHVNGAALELVALRPNSFLREEPDTPRVALTSEQRARALRLAAGALVSTAEESLESWGRSFVRS